MKPISTQIYFPAIHLNPTIKEISDFHILQCTWIWDSIQPYDPSNTFAHARLVFTLYVTEYPPKLGDIRGYHLGEYSPIFKPTSTTISLHLNFDSRWESVYWFLQKKENICLFIKPYQSTLKRKDTTQQIENCSKQFFHMHCRIMIWRIKTQWPFFFARKHVRIFVLGFLEANSSPRVSLSENCLHPGTNNVCGQISEHIFAPNRGYCLCQAALTMTIISRANWTWTSQCPLRTIFQF